jgi:3-phosphoshikimate 1-carboxyvinyltransferase
LTLQNKQEIVTITPIKSLRGEVELPGDKSIAHRAAVFAALAKGESLFNNFPGGQDPLTTVSCLANLGIEYEFAGKTLWIQSAGMYYLRESHQPLDAKNSGTTMRLLAGLLSGQSFSSVLTGDVSLLNRPMRRVIKPLTMMNARISGTRQGTAPIKIRGVRGPLRSINYQLPVASAQVKTAILLAGLFASGTTTIIEPYSTRDHTERMLGLPVKKFGGKSYVSINKTLHIPPIRMTIPGDPSTAAFLIVAALITPDSEVVVKNVSLNPTRVAFLSVLERMGANIVIMNKRNPDGEPIGDICARSSTLRGCRVEGALIPLIIDEIPILAIAGACSQGYFEVRDAVELRYKESDRINSVVTVLSTMGIKVLEQDNGFIIQGGTLRGGVTLDSFGDHRLAMASVIAGLAADDEVTVNNMGAAAISFPDFLNTIDMITNKTEVQYGKCTS